jgi:hypothetical protein
MSLNLNNLVFCNSLENQNFELLNISTENYSVRIVADLIFILDVASNVDLVCSSFDYLVVRLFWKLSELIFADLDCDLSCNLLWYLKEQPFKNLNKLELWVRNVSPGNASPHIRFY